MPGFFVIFFCILKDAALSRTNKVEKNLEKNIRLYTRTCPEFGSFTESSLSSATYTNF